MQQPETQIFSGKSLTLGGSHKINQFSNDSLYGDLSAILIENAPFWVEIIRTPKQKIALLEDFEEKLDLITRLTVNENVTSISGVPSWYLVLIKTNSGIYRKIKSFGCLAQSGSIFSWRNKLHTLS